jgi:hypothetical protein
MPKLTHPYGEKTAFEDFYGSNVPNETLAEAWAGNNDSMLEFVRKLKGVNGQLKYLHFRRVHFPAIDDFLNSKVAEALHKAGGNPAETRKVYDKHPAAAMLESKVGHKEMVWPVWCVTSKLASVEDIILAPIYCTDMEDDEKYGHCGAWGELSDLMGQSIYADELLGLAHRNPNDKEEAVPTDWGDKMGYSPWVGDGSDHWLVNNNDVGATVYHENVYELLNFYFVNCKNMWMSPYIRCINRQEDNHTDRSNWPDSSILKNFRIPYTHVRILEETADFIGTNNLVVITRLIRDYSGDIVLNTIKDAVKDDPAALKAITPRFELWRDALIDFAEVSNAEIPTSLEKTSALAAADAKLERRKQANDAITALSKNMEMLQLGIQAIKDGQEKDRGIDGGTFGDEPGGSLVGHGKTGHTHKRVNKLNYVNYMATHGKISAVMTDYTYSENGFEFEGAKPNLFRTASAKFERDKPVKGDTLTADLFVGYRIKVKNGGDSTEAIVDRFNRALADHHKKAGKGQPRTLAAEWLEWSNMLPLEALANKGQQVVIPDPRTLPDGNPPASDYPIHIS